ncbi:putative protein EIN4-like [Capsicum annuum]|nr:putative protein EIN4-like [Capsicum annuum]
MDVVWINYCDMPVYFGWKEFTIVTGLKYYPPYPSQVIPTLTQKKAPRTPKKGKGKSSNREDLVSIVGSSFKNKILIEALKGKGISKKHKQSLCLVWPSSEIEKLAKILPTYLDMSGFLDQKVRTDWSTIEAYQDKMGNPFDVQYVKGIAQQIIGSLNCGHFVATYAEHLSNGLQVPNDRLDTRLLRKRYTALLWKYGEAKLRSRTQETLKIHDDQSRIS